MALSLPLNLNKWIDEHRDHLKPRAGAKTVWTDTDFIVTIVERAREKGVIDAFDRFREASNNIKQQQKSVPRNPKL